MTPRQISRQFGLGDLLSNRDGSATIEYAVLFGVVTTGLIVGVFWLGQMSRTGFDSAATAIGSLPSTSRSDSHVASQASASGAALRDAPGATRRWQITAMVVALAVACGARLSFVALRILGKPLPDEPTKAKAEVQQAPTHEDIAFAKRQQVRRVFENNMASLLDGHLKVRHIMSRQLTCVRETASIESVLELMEAKQVRHIMVIDPGGKLLGTISDRACAQRKGTRASDIMTADPLAMDVDSDLSPAVTMLIRRRTSCLPVTSDGKLTGILTTTDFLMALQCALHTLSNVVEFLSSSRANTNSDNNTAVS